MKLNSNKGMYLEQVINNSIEFYKKHNIALINKLPIPIKIFENRDNIVKGKLYLKSNVDYYGVYKGKFICIEAKQTNEKAFYLRNLAEHQYDYLELVTNHGGLAYLIVYFNLTNTFYRIEFSEIMKDRSLKKLEQDWCKEHGKELTVFFPGRIEILF